MNKAKTKEPELRMLKGFCHPAFREGSLHVHKQLQRMLELLRHRATILVPGLGKGQAHDQIGNFFSQGIIELVVIVIMHPFYRS